MTRTNSDADSSMKPRRRRLLAAGIGVAAALAGAGVAWWRLKPGAVATEAESAFWQQRFETPTGSSLVIQALHGRPVLVNFWATWCPPCVEELPLLDRFFKENVANSWQVIGLAIDQPSSVRTFLQKTPVSFPIGLAGLGGTELGKSLGNLTGALPFTVVFGGEGKILHRKMGKITPADLQAWAGLR
jgi:thiol-disulfide isomerase/thioredoxin